VLTTVLPDDAEVTGEDHLWEWLASLIRNHGVAVTPEQLKAVPYVLEFGPRLLAATLFAYESAAFGVHVLAA